MIAILASPARADVVLGAGASYLRVDAQGADEHHLAIAPVDLGLGRRVHARWRAGVRLTAGLVRGRELLIDLRALAEARWTGARWRFAAGAGVHVLAPTVHVNPDHGAALGLRVGRKVARRWAVELAVTASRFAADAWIASSGLAVTWEAP